MSNASTTTPGAAAPLQRHSVRIPNSEENSEWFVDAHSPEQAADIYVQAIVDEKISVMASDLFEAWRVEVTALPALRAEPGLIGWEDVITIRVSVDEIPAFTAAVARGWNEDGAFDEPDAGPEA